MIPADLSSALAALADAEDALRTLDDGCCEPGRSPRMAAIGETLHAARSSLERMTGDAVAATDVLDALEDAGAQIGRLQVGCCAPGRLPLYVLMLQRLTDAQLDVTRSLGRGH